MMHKAWRSIEEMPYCVLRLSIEFQVYMGKKIDDLIPILGKISRPVTAIKSLRFALVCICTSKSVPTFYIISIQRWYHTSSKYSVFIYIAKLSYFNMMLFLCTQHYVKLHCILTWFSCISNKKLLLAWNVYMIIFWGANLSNKTPLLAIFPYVKLNHENCFGY